MSMNLCLYASVIAESKVGTHLIRNEYPLYQTPTTVTHEILASSDIKQAYIDWLTRFAEDDTYTEDVYDEDDIFQEKEPIGTKEVTPHSEHLARLEAFLITYKDWTIEWIER